MADKAKKNKIHCMGCQNELEEDHTGVTCTSNHHICSECSKSFVHEVLASPADHIPLKCMICKQKIIHETFERQLNPQQLQTFLLYNLELNPKHYLAANEIVVACPFCRYFEINTKNAGRLLFLCKHINCMKSSCFWCKKVIKNVDECDEKKCNMDPEAVEVHFECAQLAPIKEKWDAALSKGNTQPCPKCGLCGMKNNACTHMTCVRCKCQWCYVCGLDLAKLNKAHGIPDIMGHNINWKKNVHRCPMYLDNIVEIDERWPDNDSEACVAFFHQIKTKKLLKRVITELGNEQFALLCKKYNVSETCGFDITQVMDGEHEVIIRKEINNEDEEDSSEFDSEEESD